MSGSYNARVSEVWRRSLYLGFRIKNIVVHSWDEERGRPFSIIFSPETQIDIHSNLTVATGENTIY